MAATTKTLTPTNETISIPAFTDKPDNRLQTDSTGKLADAVNALSEQMANITWTKITVANNVGSSRFYKNDGLKLVWAVLIASPGAQTKQWTLPSEVPAPKEDFDTICWCMSNAWAALGAGTVQLRGNREINFTGLQSTGNISANALYPYT